MRVQYVQGEIKITSGSVIANITPRAGIRLHIPAQSKPADVKEVGAAVFDYLSEVEEANS